MGAPRRGGYNDDDQPGTAAVVPAPPVAGDGSGQVDATAPLGDDSGRLDSVLTGPGTGANAAGPLFGTANATLAGVQNPGGTPAPTDYTGTYHHITEQDYQQNQEWKKDVGDKWGFGPVSHNDLDRMHFGIEEPAKITAAQNAQASAKHQLDQLGSTLNGGDIDAVDTADDILKPGEQGLAFFQFFAPAYNDWKGGGITYDAAKQAYEAEYGMSFADYSADSKTMADLSTQLVSIQQNLNNSYNELVPTWQGDAAANFEAKMAVFFKAAGTVTQDVATAGKDVAALVAGLQQLVLAKAQTVSELYADELPNGIDGVMAQSLVSVAKGDGDTRMNLTAFSLLGGKIDNPSLIDQVFNPFAEIEAKVEAAAMAPQLAAQWCNAVLVPQFEAREQALTSVNTETQQRIEQGFAEFTKQLSGIHDPFAAMAEAKAATGPTHPAQSGGGAGGPGAGGAAPSGGGIPSGGGVPSGNPVGATSPAAFFAPTPHDTSPTTATTPTLPDPSAPIAGTGAAPTDPTAIGLGVPPGIDIKHDIHHNRDGSVSLGRDRGLTISPEHGKKGIFRLTNTDASGTTHTYRVHFDKKGNPVVTEVPAPSGLDDVTSPAAQLPTGLGGSVAGSFGGGATGGDAGIPSGGAIPTSGGIPSGGAIPTSGGAPQVAAAAHAGNLAQGAQVGADNTMSSANAPAQSSPVAGSAAPAQQSGGHQGGAVGGMPMGAGMGRGSGGGEQESGRKYPQHGDIVGDEDVEEWQRMGPVIGEQ